MSVFHSLVFLLAAVEFGFALDPDFAFTLAIDQYVPIPAPGQVRVALCEGSGPGSCPDGVDITPTKGDPAPCGCDWGFVFYRDKGVQMVSMAEQSHYGFGLGFPFPADDPTLEIVRAARNEFGCTVQLSNGSLATVVAQQYFNNLNSTTVLPMPITGAWDWMKSSDPHWSFVRELTTFYSTDDVPLVISGPVVHVNGTLGMAFNALVPNRTVITPFPRNRQVPVAAWGGVLEYNWTTLLETYVVVTAQPIKFIHHPGQNLSGTVMLDYFEGDDLQQGFGPSNISFVRSINVGPIDFCLLTRIDKMIVSSNNSMQFVQYGTSQPNGTVLVQFLDNGRAFSDYTRKAVLYSDAWF